MVLKDSVSFMVNHDGMERGIYLARVDRFMGTVTLTVDIRVRRPYADSALSDGDMHTCEHSFATCIREEAAGSDDLTVLYFGPMGCATGFYFLLQLADTASEGEYATIVCRLLRGACLRMESMDEVPANNKYQCGNYLTLLDMDSARVLSSEIGLLAAEAEKQGGFHQYKRLTEETLLTLLKK